MSSTSRFDPQIEPLEARIAPAIIISNPLPDLSVGPGKTGATIDLSQLTAPLTSGAYHTKVKFITNVDMDATTAGLQAGEIVIELFDDLAPRTVQAFLRYVTNTNASGDYDGTIIHRSFDFQEATPRVNDIIQGGGFNFPGFAHIPTGPEIFNEYSATQKNVRGTIALAKTAQGPSTGTSEWFFNVSDNSDTLGGPESPTGDNNGGFAVFGKVISGLDVVDAIAALGTQNFGGAFGNTPVQSAVTGLPNADQLVRIVDAAVLPATPVTTGLTYSITSIFKVGTNGLATTMVSDAVKGTVNNFVTPGATYSTLNLQYVAGKTGRADVVLKVTDGTDTTEETFRVDLRPNLFLIDTDTQLLIPGNVASLKFKVINDGASAISGPVRIELSFQRTDITGAPVIPLGVQTATLALAAGASQVLTVKTAIPASLATSLNETYEVTAKIVPLAAERDATDNDSSGGSHRLVNQFGNVAGVGKVVLKYNLGGGTVNWTLNGSGVGSITPDGAGKFILETTGTNLATTVAAVSSKTTARTPLAGIQFDSALGGANIPSVDVSGLIAISGGIKTLTLGDLTGQSLLLIGPVLGDDNAKAIVSARNVTNFSIESAMPLASLTVATWLDTNSSNDSIIAPSLGSLKSAGDFQADVTLLGEAPLTSIAIKGRLSNATIKTAGNIGAVVLGGINAANVFAGVEARPGALGEFTEARTIQSFTIAGIAGDSAPLFVDSQVAAQTLGSIVVKGVSATGAGDFGFVADVIRSYSRAASATAPAFIRSNLSAPQTADDLGDYLVRVL